MNVWFTSDTHFGHANIIKYCNRPFKDVEDMDNTMIANWNSVVREEDTVYHLGDFAWGDSMANIMAVTEKLNGRIYIIPGNHDPEKLFDAANRPGAVWGFEGVRMQGYMLRLGKQILVLSHYAMRVWERSHKGSYCLYGHTHGALPEDNTLGTDVGVDARNYFPVSASQIISELQAKDQRLREQGIDPWDPWGIVAKNKWDKTGEVKYDTHRMPHTLEQFKSQGDF